MFRSISFVTHRHLAWCCAASTEGQILTLDGKSEDSIRLEGGVASCLMEGWSVCTMVGNLEEKVNGFVSRTLNQQILCFYYCVPYSFQLERKIPQSACLKTYEVRDSQGVIWAWMSDRRKPNTDKLPWFEHYVKPESQDVSTIHELPYDHSILLENLMDPAHVPISHDRTDYYSKKEDAQPLLFEDMGFLSSQNEVLLEEKLPTGKLYINLNSSDTWVAEYRKWMDKVGHGMPYYLSHSSISFAKDHAVMDKE
ncbi:hypothetical protein J5N97_008210 [Dioscorea zingiberensis]|uniref:Uncharacterized protein n=1 Tax=Dioscorea zingiberensis TaxID=325984 RepID=A0A9D5HVG3_9LILI|nr:hypothetical protein J5N97_008210 [Dioscorea zingiberensis]